MRSRVVLLLALLAACGGAGKDADAGPDAGADGPTTGSVLDCGFHEDLAQGEEYLHFATADDASAVLIVRFGDPNNHPGGISQGFGLGAMALRLGETLHCIDQSDRLDYISTLHNWVDSATGTLGDGRRYRLSMEFQPPDNDPTGQFVWSHWLFEVDAQGTQIGDRVEVVHRGGRDPAGPALQ